MEALLLDMLLVSAVLILVSSLDDAFLDIAVFVKTGSVGERRVPSSAGKAQHAAERTSEHPGSSDAFSGASSRPAVGIFVANWHEADVLEAMVDGNLCAISYRPLKFYLGVYPNDDATWRAANRAASTHPDLVEVIVNRLDGPTSKGQMLNEMFAVVFGQRTNAPELSVIHDSEDVIDPRSFDLYASLSATHQFIQIPVFSLNSRHRSAVAATYMEEFAERHTREMVLRAAVGAAIPSAGVGTCLHRDLILNFLSTRGHVLRPACVTEDYLLGVEAHRAGFRCTFVMARSGMPPEDPIIATREYFPKSFGASVRQKTRWVYGICFEGMRQLGWSKDPWLAYFLYRDRKSLVTNLLPPFALALFGLTLISGAHSTEMGPIGSQVLAYLLVINTCAIALRLYIKHTSFRYVYERSDLVGVSLRWPVAIAVNAIAVFRAWRTFVVEARLATRPIAWAKTVHELPPDFASMGTQTPAWSDVLAVARSLPLAVTARTDTSLTPKKIRQGAPAMEPTSSRIRFLVGCVAASVLAAFASPLAATPAQSQIALDPAGRNFVDPDRELALARANLARATAMRILANEALSDIEIARKSMQKKRGGAADSERSPAPNQSLALLPDPKATGNEEIEMWKRAAAQAEATLIQSLAETAIARHEVSDAEVRYRANLRTPESKRRP